MTIKNREDYLKKQAEKIGDFDQFTANIMRNKFYSKATDKNNLESSESLTEMKRDAPPSPESQEANAVKLKRMKQQNASGAVQGVRDQQSISQASITSHKEPRRAGQSPNTIKQ